MKRLAVLGAHTELAQAILACVEERELPIALARYTTTEHLAEGLDLLGPGALEGADAVLICFTGDLARGLAEGARKAGILVFDAAGAVADEPEARWVWPILDEGWRADAAYTLIPTGLAEPIAAVLRALALFGPERVRVRTMESAAAFDRPGIDALLAEVRDIYSMKEVEPSVFEGQLAFSAVASEALDEVRLEDQLDDALAGLEPAPEIRASRLLGPALSVDHAVVHVDLAEPIDRERFVAALAAARGVRHAEGLRSAVEVAEREDALVGRVWVEGRYARFWVVADRLRRGAATPVAALLERWAADPE